MLRNLHISSVAQTHLAEGLCPNGLRMLKIENPRTCLVGMNAKRDRVGVVIGSALGNINKK
jgi:hypothetical protein